MAKLLVITLLAGVLAVTAPPLAAQQWHGYMGTMQILVGTDGNGNFGYVENGYGRAKIIDLPGLLFTDLDGRNLEAIGFSRNGTEDDASDDYFFLRAQPKPDETASEIPYAAAATQSERPPLWIRMDIRQANQGVGDVGDVIQRGNLWRGTTGTCPTDTLCWKAFQPIPVGDDAGVGPIGVETPAEGTYWLFDFFNAETEAVNYAGGGSGAITFVARVQESGGTTTLSCTPTPAPTPCYIAGGYPPEAVGNTQAAYNGRLLSIVSAPDAATITLTTDAGTPFNSRLAGRYSVTLVDRVGEPIGLPADMTGDGVDATSPDTITITLQPDSYTESQLLALNNQVVSLVFTNEGMARLIDRTPGPRPGLSAQLLLGLIAGGSAFFIAGIGRYITPAREIIATVVVAAAMSIPPAFNWGGSFWFVGGVVVLMLIATFGLMALKSKSG